MNPKAPKAGWPKPHPVHSPENKTDQAWKSGTIQVFATCGNVTKLFDMEEGLYKCKCGGIVRYDTRGIAACELCGYVFNDGKPQEIQIKSKITTRSFIYNAFNKVE